MSRLLFCWELGANFGHLSTIASLLERLARKGHGVTFAVADLKVARELLGPSAQLVQAPSWSAYKHRGSRIEAASFADVLALVGYADPAFLGAVVDGWLTLFGLAASQAIICDHSPAAQLAARIAGLPTISLGTAFTQPPLDYPMFPPLRADIGAAVPETILLDSARHVLAAHGVGCPLSLPELFGATRRLVIGLPELDPYRSFRRELLHAPAGGFPAPQPGPGKAPRLFAYLGPEIPDIEAKVQALCALAEPVEIFVRGGDPLLRDFIRRRGKVAYDRPIVMKEALQRASHVVSPGGAMLASEALAAGVPHLVLPTHRETHLNGSLVTGLGYGRMVDPGLPVAAFRTSLAQFMGDRELEKRTLEFATILTDRPLPDAGDALLAGIAAAVPDVQDGRPVAAAAAPAS